MTSTTRHQHVAKAIKIRKTQSMTTYESDFNDLCVLFGVADDLKEIVAINPPFID